MDAKKHKLYQLPYERYLIIDNMTRLTACVNDSSVAVRVVTYVINYLNSGKLKTECDRSMALSQENLTFDNT